jgi:hypothetical protein
LSHVLTDTSLFWHRHTRSGSHRAAHELRRPTRTAPPRAVGERILRRFDDEAEQIVVTNHALYRRVAEDWLRIDWLDIAVVGWSGEERAVVLRQWPSSAGRSEIRVPADPALAAIVRERVAATRLLLTHAEIRPGVIAIVTALRCPADDTVRWRVFVEGQDATGDPAFRAACERVIAELRGLAGC